MSRGTTLFSCGTVGRWLGMGRGCALQQGAPCQSGSSLESLWDILPAQSSQPWAKEPGSSAITSLIRDLSLGDSTPAAPPSKRQCRSLSFSDEFGSFRSCWRPQGSRVWTAVEKRRCHSGGSVRGGSALSGSNLPVMQRSSSFSLPSRCSLPFDGPLDLLPELQTEEASEASSPDSTPELSRRAAQRSSGKGCLSRSRSQPCVIDKKISMKRRRPEDAQEQRPSLDLAKMTQNLQTFQSLSCPGFSVADSFPVPSFENRPELDFNNRSAQPRLEPRPEETEDLSYGEDSDSACSVDSRSGSPDVANDTKHTLWKGAMQQRDIFQLGGELDLDQIERN
uniref:Family with sequence similarity 53 member B n=1 Tax=Neogobius melanostomus TaxID=47308 RepID=A0A8C6U586_9GOBI